METNITNNTFLLKVKNLSKHKFGSNSEFLFEDISFDIKEGELLLLRGANGCGKTTLLKILNKIYPYTDGEITLNSKITSILNNTLPFSDFLDMRMNIFLMGSLLGFTNSQINSVIDKIVNLSEIKTKSTVMNFSTGMKARLSFSIIKYLSHNLIILDEVMANIDQSFKKTAIESINYLIYKKNKSIVMVDHNNFINVNDFPNLKYIKLTR